MEAYITIAVVAYVIGSINFAVLISKKLAGFDVRERGSKNAGTTNILRTVGKKAALITLICDILKGVVAILVALSTKMIWTGVNIDLLKYIAGFMVIIGHTYPIFFDFKGGKGVATSIGVLLMLNWKVGLICLAFGLLVIACTKMVSLGSMCGAVLFPILSIFMQEDMTWPQIALCFAIALLVIFNHRTNIKRIIQGKENKLSFKTNNNKENKPENSTENNNNNN